MKQALKQGRSQQVAYGLAAHAGRELRDLFTGDKIALHDIDLVRRHNPGQTVAGTIEAGTSHQARANSQIETMAGTVMDWIGHGMEGGDMMLAL